MEAASAWPGQFPPKTPKTIPKRTKLRRISASKPQEFRVEIFARKFSRIAILPAGG
jgi:hypothetical protein